MNILLFDIVFPLFLSLYFLLLPFYGLDDTIKLEPQCEKNDFD